MIRFILSIIYSIWTMKVLLIIIRNIFLLIMMSKILNKLGFVEMMELNISLYLFIIIGKIISEGGVKVIKLGLNIFIMIINNILFIKQLALQNKVEFLIVRLLGKSILLDLIKIINHTGYAFT